MAKRKKLELEVVGMHYRLTPSTITKMTKDVPLKCELKREPDNPADENAVMVLVTEKPYGKEHGGMPIGYIARATASVIAPSIDAGEWPFDEIWLTEIDDLRGVGQLMLKQKSHG
jgi:hypothetical protein